MEVNTIIVSSKEVSLIDQIQKLGDANRQTLGFLPAVVFKKAVNQKHIIACVGHSNSLLGYLLFRVSSRKNAAFIVHLCIHESARGKGVTKKLLDKLYELSINLNGVGLMCRNDYVYATKTWEKNGFFPVKEKRGRSKEGKPLTYWWKPNKNVNTLFSNVIEPETLVCIDYCVANDIYLERSEESKGLLEDWLKSEIKITICDEYLKEVLRDTCDYTVKNAKRNFIASKFDPILINQEEQRFRHILDDLSSVFSPKNESEESDLIHLASAIYSEADYFVTQDQKLLKKAQKIQKEHDVEVLFPGEFIARISEQTNKHLYEPEDAAVKVIEKKKLSTNELADVEFFINHLSGEKPEAFKKKIKTFLAHPSQYNVTLFRNTIKGNQPIALIVTQENNGFLNVPILRFSKVGFRTTLVKNIIYGLLGHAVQASNQTLVRVSDPLIPDQIRSILIESKFIYDEKNFKKFLVKEILTKEDANEKIVKLLPSTGATNDATVSSIDTIELERYFWPLKVDDKDVPCYIMPIQPKWAKRLFDENVNKEELFPHDHPELILNRENVYYKSNNQKIEQKARILWYVSKDKSSSVKQIRAASYITNVVTGEPKEIYKENQHLGIYKWEDVSGIAKNSSKNTILAFRFADTELFKTPISYDAFSKIYFKSTRKQTTLPTILKIKNRLFLELYGKGMGLYYQEKE